jgi:hypothetical protein
MSDNNNFQQQFFNFLDLVQSEVQNALSQEAEIDPQVTQSTAKVWFLLEGLNSYVSSREQVEGDLLELGIDMIAEEMFKPYNLLVLKTPENLIESYKRLKLFFSQESQKN